MAQYCCGFSPTHQKISPSKPWGPLDPLDLRWSKLPSDAEGLVRSLGESCSSVKALFADKAMYKACLIYVACRHSIGCKLWQLSVPMCDSTAIGPSSCRACWDHSTRGHGAVWGLGCLKNWAEEFGIKSHQKSKHTPILEVPKRVWIDMWHDRFKML